MISTPRTVRTFSGFTIVELLIVIVVIGILAAISIVAYTSVQNRGHDSAIQNDLRTIAKQFELYRIDNQRYPTGDADLGTMRLRVARSSYGNGIISNTYNLLYCRVAADGPDKFALIAGSKSGNVFTYRSEASAITSASTWTDMSNSMPNCQAAGINQTIGTDRDFFYLSGNWRPYTN
ncbi:MAG: prepilin-type N-terminal cleavage/methylation domain-containing protein [Candidatus Saccharimonadales bacterium]